MSDRVDTELSNGEELDRRRFVGLGALTIGGVALTNPFTERAVAAPKKSTAVIQVFLSGGPSQIDTFDPKPGAPADYRGPFAALRTKVAGVQLSEMFPLLANQMDRFSIVRSVTHGVARSSTAQHLMNTGWMPASIPATTNDRPAVGAVAATLRGSRSPGVPAYVSLPRITPFASAGFLSLAADPFEVSDPGPNFATLRTVRPSIALDAEKGAALSANKITHQRGYAECGKGLDRSGIDTASQTAANLAASPAIHAALNVEQENAALRARYGATALGQRLLLARRLVEAGVTYVTVEESGWDMHSQIEERMHRKGPKLDQAVSALATDLSERGMFNNVLIVVYGEFGRSARMNKADGRGNSGSVFSVLLGGGGLRSGVVVGSSDARGEARPATTPVGPGDVLATIYSVLGIDPHSTIQDASGKPTPLLPRGTPIKELLA